MFLVFGVQGAGFLFRPSASKSRRPNGVMSACCCAGPPPPATSSWPSTLWADPPGLPLHYMMVSHDQLMDGWGTRPLHWRSVLVSLIINRFSAGMLCAGWSLMSCGVIERAHQCARHGCDTSSKRCSCNGNSQFQLPNRFMPFALLLCMGSQYLPPFAKKCELLYWSRLWFRPHQTFGLFPPAKVLPPCTNVPLPRWCTAAAKS